MKNFLEKTLRQKILMKANKSLYSKLPLFFKGRYDFFDVVVHGVRWIAIQPKTDVGLVTLRKDWAKVQNIAALNCALFFNSTTCYIKDKLLDDGIPFVVANKQLYLPFIGCLLSISGDREIPPVSQISFVTQKLVLTAIYEKWSKVTVSEAATKLQISKMTASKCFDEIEFLNIDILDNKGKSRAITIPLDIKPLWEKLQQILRNPVIAKYELRDDIHLQKKAGMTALCKYSLLTDNVYPTYGITKKEFSETDVRKMNKVRRGEEIGCVVLELGYFIDLHQDAFEDPLSVILSLTDEDTQDERVKIATEQMLEEYVW